MSHVVLASTVRQTILFPHSYLASNYLRGLWGHGIRQTGKAVTHFLPHLEEVGYLIGSNSEWGRGASFRHTWSLFLWILRRNPANIYHYGDFTTCQAPGGVIAITLLNSCDKFCVGSIKPIFQKRQLRLGETMQPAQSHRGNEWWCWAVFCCCLVAQWCPTLCDLMDCSLPGSSVHGISPASILEWAVISSSSRSSQPRHLLHWQTESLSLSHLGSPGYVYAFSKLRMRI